MTSTFRSARNPFRALLVAASLALVSTPLVAQDPETLFLEGMSAYRGGDFEGALGKFREVIALDPSHADAVALMNDSQDSLVQLLVEGGEFEVFARHILDAATTARAELMRDEAAIDALAEEALVGDYGPRSQAIFRLSMTHGPFGVPPLVRALASDDNDRRLNAIYALARMGSDSLVPLVTALQSPNAEVRRGALLVLGEVGDARASAAIADAAAHDEDGTVRALAAELASGDPATLHYEQAWAMYVHDPRLGLTEFENHGVLWTIDGSRLSSYDVPKGVVALELAKYHFGRAAALGHGDAAAGLALTYGAEIAVLDGGGMSDEAAAQANAALTLSQDALDRALLTALERGEVATAGALIDLLGGPGLVATSGLQSALASGTPSLRFGAAIALAHAGYDGGDIVGALGDAVELEALRIVQIVDGNAGRAGALASALEAQGIVAMVAGDGIDGLVNVHRGLPVDAFVVADPLDDMYARRFVAQVRRFDSYADTPVMVIGGEDTGDIDSAEVSDSVDAGAVTAAFGELGAERETYIATAAAAAGALDSLAARNAGSASGAAASLLVAAGRDDAVAVPAMAALSRIGDASTASGLLAIVADGGRSSAARAAAASALAGVFGANQGLGIDARGTLEAAMAEGDAEVSRACARALGLLGGGHAAAMITG